MAPIIGLTTGVTPGFTPIGSIRKGMKVSAKTKEGKDYMKMVDLEYFRFTSRNPDVEAVWLRDVGAEPQSLQVILTHATANEAFTSWQEEWSAGGMVHQCDGQTMVKHRLPSGRMSTAPAPCPYFAGAAERTIKNPGCKQVGRLTVVIPQLIKAGHVGPVIFETHSIHDLLSIQAALEEAESQVAAAGNPMGLRGIPFRLWRQADEISTPSTEEGKRVRREKWLVKIAPDHVWVAVQYQIAQRAALSLPAGGGPAVGAEDDVEEGEWFALPENDNPDEEPSPSTEPETAGGTPGESGKEEAPEPKTSEPLHSSCTRTASFLLGSLIVLISPNR